MVDFYVELLTKVYNVLHRSAFEDMPATFVVLFWINAVYTGIVGLVAFFRFNEDRMSVFSVATTVVYTIVHYAIITLLTFLTVFLHPIVTLIAMILTVVIGFMFTTDEDLEYFRSASQEGDNITRIDLAHLSVQEGLGEKITPERIARYVIPIALAWKTLVPKNKKFSSTNLLPNRVIENQKYFKIAWHGFLVLAAIFYFAFAGTIKNLELKQDIIDYGKKNYQIERELSKNRELIKRLNEIKTKLNKLQENLLKVERITGNKNQWNHILDVYSKSLNRNRLSWISDLSSNNEGFTVDGYTTNRRAVIAFSKLFPEMLNQLIPVPLKYVLFHE